ncbi:MAG: hypothetical protein ACKO2Z_36735, partial [Sphaerospermopsis kisseleviana]
VVRKTVTAAASANAKCNRHLQKRNYGTYLWGQGEAFGISRCLIFPLNYRPNASPLQLMTN